MALALYLADGYFARYQAWTQKKPVMVPDFLIGPHPQIHRDRLRARDQGYLDFYGRPLWCKRQILGPDEAEAPENGRADWIRTSDPYTPSVVRYQTALRPAKGIRQLHRPIDRKPFFPSGKNFSP